MEVKNVFAVPDFKLKISRLLHDETDGTVVFKMERISKVHESEYFTQTFQCNKCSSNLNITSRRSRVGQRSTQRQPSEKRIYDYIVSCNVTAQIYQTDDCRKTGSPMISEILKYRPCGNFDNLVINEKHTYR
ncbi:hypothetical protein RF11_15078 [Thelohanellus kitauei]|uniref:Uncharacterized protein n=1 Tax=Thelohanellus kitauei TaxID=669202 RepID=A0A0C2IC36_THEKT|nr:hypothetical protein RF11_15078 [Thelohanellus kitauei]